MANRAELRLLVRRRLGDMVNTYNFADEQINQWINDAIADYNIQFPKREYEDITCTAGTHEYVLDIHYRGVLKVQYPVSEDPPRYLTRLDHRHPDFFLSDEYYDIAEKRNSDEVGVLDRALIVGEVKTGQKIRLYYLAEHEYLSHDLQVTTIPDRHLELIVYFCRWAAFQELAMSESMNPDPTGLALGTLELNVTRAERLYRKLLDKYFESEGESGLAEWRMDGWDRVY